MGRKLINIAGQRFGKLVAIRPTETNRDGGSLWLCQCDCGNQVEVASGSLRGGRTKSCGCLLNPKDISGKTFGYLKAINYAGNRKWNCECVCGNHKEFSAYALEHGNAKSCGCKHPHKLVDLTGRRFEKLTVIDRAENGKHKEVMWNCVCDCGNLTVKRAFGLLNGISTSCGCETRKKLSESTRNNKKKHGETHTRLYRIHQQMKRRCDSPYLEVYQYYGGKGVTVCQEWLDSYEAFRDWALANGYSDDLTIDRIDVNGNYCPENCRWVDMKTQCRNRTSNIQITAHGETHCVSEWSEITGISAATIYMRIRRGWNTEKLFEPIGGN